MSKMGLYKQASICFLLFFLFVTCNGQGNREDGIKKEKNISESSDTIRQNVIQHVDTLVGLFRIDYTIIESLDDTILKDNILATGDKVKYEYRNREICLNIDYRKTTILKKKVNKNDFTSIIPKDKVQKYQIWSFDINNISDTLAIFSLNICVPDTDDCYSVLYSVSNTGKITISEEEVIWED
ncbi:MAG: DUF4738 domain-containing protein [Prevotella sp.]|jgi:hypothetical protein|uniref:DUF4738 domain-containing protein n=1 Tax=unclassified Dysgonomonas TaxID=2630389 RepID=UPI0025BA1D8C|nr:MULTISPECIES: DUF4738 domain-containing protein [unclassified Dysgonomonas]MDR1715712.1 DUF4738 domain-containing protein [Prevotella sp.]MDR2002368.1 DUF4738 domain-containing protein [Prevotella sp.]HMM05000.1 DUF4738 domain-containing protein [Dysgonomonas sp.]